MNKLEKKAVELFKKELDKNPKLSKTKTYTKIGKKVGKGVTWVREKVNCYVYFDYEKNKAIGSNIKSYREREGFSQRELGAMICKTQAFMSRAEKGEEEFNDITLKVLAKALGTTKNRLAKYEVEEPKPKKTDKGKMIKKHKKGISRKKK